MKKNIIYGATVGTGIGLVNTATNFVGGGVQVVSNIIPANPLELVTRKMAYLNGSVKPSAPSLLSGLSSLLGGSSSSGASIPASAASAYYR